MKPHHATEFAVIDFETTGLSPKYNHRVVEVGLVLLDRYGNQQGSWTTLVNPHRHIGTTRIHGITAGELLDAPDFDEISDYLLECIDGRAIVAHNASFDMRFLEHELLRAGYDIGGVPPAVCSMKWSRRLIGPSKLAHCCEALDIPFKNAHAAIADAEATASLFGHLLDWGPKYHEWFADIDLSLSFDWPRSKGRPSGRQTLRREEGIEEPSSWMQRVNNEALLPVSSEDESNYLELLSGAMLDLSISETEGRGLARLASEVGISRDRMMELHRSYLGELAAAAWSDGVVTGDEVEQMVVTASALGLSKPEVTEAILTNKGRQAKGATSLLGGGDRIVFTGELSCPRAEFIDRILAAGLTTGGISKSTRLVVTSDPDSLSGKAAKARQYGVPVVDEAGFERVFERYLESVQ